MKKHWYKALALLLCCMLLLAVPAAAAVYAIPDTDITLEIDDSVWKVFTRDSFRDNPELDEVFLTYEDLENLFSSGNASMVAVYTNLEAVQWAEFQLIKTEGDRGGNLADWSETIFSIYMQTIADKYAEEFLLLEYGTYETDYRYVKVEYAVTDSDESTVNLFVTEYHTVVNNDTYLLRFYQFLMPDDDTKAMMKTIVDSAVFEIDILENDSFFSKALFSSSPVSAFYWESFFGLFHR